MATADYEVLAQQVSALTESLARLERRMAEAKRVNARLEQAALSTSRAMEEISRQWDAVYEAMRRAESSDSDEATQDVKVSADQRPRIGLAQREGRARRHSAAGATTRRLIGTLFLSGGRTDGNSAVLPSPV